MTKIGTINLKAFRKENHMTQGDLAKFFETSRGFVSMIESGRSKLPTTYINKILHERINNRKWNIRPLNPFFYDLDILAKYLCQQDKELKPEFNWETGENPFSISPEIILNIKYGPKYEIEPIVEMIVERFPNVNRKWLLTEDGEMFLSPQKTRKIQEQKAKKIQEENLVTAINLLIDKIDEFGICLKNIERQFISLSEKINKE